MDAQRKVAGKTARLPVIKPSLVKDIAAALVQNALADEIQDFDRKARQAAAEFVVAAMVRRKPKNAEVCIESMGGDVGARRMRIAIVNDDMPFLVDSVAAAISARGLVTHRLLHPVVCTKRDKAGTITGIEPLCDDTSRRESVMYLEVDRADARDRAELTTELKNALADVRAAVRDWKAMQAKMHAQADEIADGEGKALLHWLADGAMTLLGYEVEKPGKVPSDGLGIMKVPGEPTDEGGCEGAMRYFEEGNPVPLIAKADLRSTVHRRVPLDLIVVPIREKGKITGVGVHAGLWTSQALTQPIEDVPVLRRHLAKLEKDFGFEQTGHSGKALRHALSSLPRDLLVNLRADDIKQLTATAISLADRPRPTLYLVRSILRGHLFAFVWLPRDELTTRRRLAIGDMIAEAAGGRITNWAVDLGDGDLALVRYTLNVDAKRKTPDARALDAKLDAMVRGWLPSIEEALVPEVGDTRARRLAIGFADDFPETYRAHADGAEAARDIVRLAALEDPAARDTRLYRAPGADRLGIKTYRLGGLIPLSEAVPVFENFGFSVIEELPTPIDGGRLGYIHDFAVDPAGATQPEAILQRADMLEPAISAVLEGRAENDGFNQLLVDAGLGTSDILLLRAWFRYLRQTGMSYGLTTVVEALRRAPHVAQSLIALFHAMHKPGVKNRDAAIAKADEAVNNGLAGVAAIDDDRILRRILSVIRATLRTNAFTPAAEEALAFKLDSGMIPGLPQPVPWREIWVYSPRVEGIHLRGGPVARGGLRWSDRRDDFRTEILGLVKAQVVKNAVIVPTGAKGGFYPKHLPPPGDRDAWLAEGTESYRIFIRALLSVTDNIVENKVVHPEGMTIRDGDDPYFVVAADKGTAAFSDVANAIALERGFWLGDAFASGGSVGYDHKAMGITAKGAWVSVQRHFLEMGVDVQKDPIEVVGCGDMSGDVFGNGMLLSKAIRLVAAFDHRHIFLDPDPDPAASWKERNRMFNLPRSSWADYDPKLISKGGGVFPRTQKEIKLSPQVRAVLGTDLAAVDPSTLINLILKAPADLIWFGGIGTYVKARHEANAEVGDPANDAHRVNGEDIRAKAIGEGANLGVTQAGRIEFSENGGRINTDFIDNSAGVDCSDNEVNIKIPLNREMREGRLSEKARNALLADMTDEVADIVLEDNRLQTLALSIAERGGSIALPSLVRAMEILEEKGVLNRAVEGLGSNEDLLRRAQDDRGLTRPELAVLLSTSKIALQKAIESGTLAEDPTLEGELMAAFPPQMQKKQAKALRQHRLRGEIIATKIANRFVNRLGITAPFALTEEEGASLGQAAAAFVAAERLFGMADIWEQLDTLDISEDVRLALFDEASRGLQLHIADILRNIPANTKLEAVVGALAPNMNVLNKALDKLLRTEIANEGKARRDRLVAMGAPADIAARIVRLYELDGGVGIAILAAKLKQDPAAITRAYTKLGEALGIDWAHGAAGRLEAEDQWERLLTTNLSQDFEQVRLEFLARRAKAGDPEEAVDAWVAEQKPRIDQFRKIVDRARTAPVTTAPMLAQIATQTRVLLGR